MKSEEVRKLVLCKLQNGETPTNIFRDLAGTVSLATIKRWKSMHGQGVDVPGRQYVRPLTASTPQNVRKVKSLSRKKLSTRKIERKLGISKSTVHEILRKKLAVKPYKRRKVPKLTPEHIRKRKSFANWVVHNFSKESSKNTLLRRETFRPGRRI